MNNAVCIERRKQMGRGITKMVKEIKIGYKYLTEGPDSCESHDEKTKEDQDNRSDI